MTEEVVQTSRTVEVVPRAGIDDEAAIAAIVGSRLDLTPYEFRRPWMRAFVAALARSGEVASAARAAEINYDHVYDVRKKDPVFAAAWREAEEVSVDLLEQLAIRRATTGEEKVVTRTTRKFSSEPQPPLPDGTAQPDRLVLVEESVVEERVNVKSDAMLMFLLKARRPDRFRERIDPARIINPDPGPVEVYRPVDDERAYAIAVLMVEERRELEPPPELPDIEGEASSNGHGALPPPG